jgi:D-amino-acid dehydrogenase
VADDVDIVVAGAGAIGLCIALQLRLEGRDVLLIDRSQPGLGASFGNAGVLAAYECVPLGTPSVLKALPRLLFDPSSPLSISISALPRLSPWLMRFACSSVERRAVQHAAVLAALLKNSIAAYLPLLERAGAMSLLRREGALHLFQSQSGLAEASWEEELRRRLGIPMSILGRLDIANREPTLPECYQHAILFHDAAHLTDPFALMQRLAQTFLDLGGRIARKHVKELTPSTDAVTVTCDDATLRARTVVVALGAWSAQLARSVGDKFPLETERGYHVEFPTPTPLLRRPVCPLALGFYLTPMEGRLRAAGTVELSSIHRPPNAKRLHWIESATRQIFPDLPPAQSKWLGFRPSLPDSLPAIGRSGRARNIIYAFGHGHLGVTLAAVTARIVTDLILENRDTPELAAISPTRFG